MNVAALRSWLAEPRPALVTAVARGVRDHIADLRSRGAEYYGYALLPGEPYDIHSLVAVTNGEADTKVPRTDDRYTYFRYSVDEWAHWRDDGFAEANRLLVEANERFASLLTRDDGDFQMDKFEVAHANALLDAAVRGLEAANHAGVFGGTDAFRAIWISDTSHLIMVESVQRLNSLNVAKEFEAWFG